jgi:hypothetical protein
LKEYRPFFAIWKETINLIHSSKGLLFDLSCGKRITQCTVGVPIGAAGPPTARAWMITTDYAFQIAGIPAAASDWMARIVVLRIVIWTGGIAQIAEVGDLA